MSETQALLGKITALRQRLEQAQSLANEARSALAALTGEDAPASNVPTGAAHALERQISAGSEHDLQLDRLVRPLVGPAGADQPRTGPRQLTARARRVLERGRELLLGLRQLAAAFEGSARETATPAAVQFERGDPLSRCYRETVALTDTALRAVPLFPDATAAQLHLCEGLEAILNVVAGRLRTLQAGVSRARQEAEQIDRLAAILRDLEAGRAVALERLTALSDDVLAEAWAGAPLRLPEADVRDVPRFVAAHALATARVAARVVRHDPDFVTHAGDAVAGALVQDAGMLRVPVEVLARPGPLDTEERRLVEAHCRTGAELLAPWRETAPCLVSAAAHHHERLDGTGYPDGLRDLQVAPLARVLAVCDVYAALSTARPHRPAHESRTALTDTLLLAEQGQLDRHYAECLLHLSFYPIGTAVELADGAVGVVVATPGGRHDLGSPAKPVVVILKDGDGRPLGAPRTIDLAQAEGPSVVRSLGRAERREVLGPNFPEWL